MAYLFQANIGPVQSFIASARRTRDLWFGSQLLSELSKAAARVIVTTYGRESLIFPAPTAQDLKENQLRFASDLNVANKIIALIETDDTPQQIGALVQKAIDDTLDTIKKDVYQQIKKNGERYYATYFNEARADQQIADLVEYNWVALECTRAEYGVRRNQMEALMAARKNTRDFQPVFWGGHSPKSSIDGQLESVITEELYSARDADPAKKRAKQLANAQNLYTFFHAGPAERLSGVDILKRLGRFDVTQQKPEEDDFLSTSHIAALPYLERIDACKNASAEKYQKVKDTFTIYRQQAVAAVPGKALDRIPPWSKGHEILGNYDGAILFPERLRENSAQGSGLVAAQQALKSFFRAVDEALETQIAPSPYYAIIQADGDGMGKLIDALANDEGGIQRHQQLSQALDAFSRNVKEIVEKDHKGAAIYAGGDDVLAFVPLHTVLACARALKDAFEEKLRPIAALLPETKKSAPTLSMGIAIVHHLSLLQDALDMVRATESRAKALKDKNALAITISKRSGEQYTVAGHWGELDTYLEQLVVYFRKDSIPRGAAYELREMEQRLTMISSGVDEKKAKESKQQLQEIMWQDAKRILQRKLNLPRSRLAEASTEINEQQRKQRFEETLTALTARIERPAQKDSTTSLLPIAALASKTPELDNQQGEQEKIHPVPLHEFIHELIIANELASVLVLAGNKEACIEQGDGGHRQ